MKKTFLFFLLVGLVGAWFSGYKLEPKHGEELMVVQSVPINYHQKGQDERGEYGMQYQCVEFVNRWLVAYGYRNLARSGNAISYLLEAQAKGLTPYTNGGPEKPRWGDVIVFSSSVQPYGHVGIVIEVGEDSVLVAQQNATATLIPLILVKPIPLERFSLKNENGSWVVESRRPLKCLGWSRP